MCFELYVFSSSRAVYKSDVFAVLFATIRTAVLSMCGQTKSVNLRSKIENFILFSHCLQCIAAVFNGEHFLTVLAEDTKEGLARH